jgi:hypothetical protein
MRGEEEGKAEERTQHEVQVGYRGIIVRTPIDPHVIVVRPGQVAAMRREIDEPRPFHGLRLQDDRLGCRQEP